MDHGPCPFEEGDRVDHKKFGFGTVTGEPVAVVSGGMRGVIPAGWRVGVNWDDPAYTANSISSDFIRKVSSPDSRPFTYWDRKWQPLLQAWLRARRDFEEAFQSFRPVADAQRLKSLSEAEARSRAALDEFLLDEAEGRHP